MGITFVFEEIDLGLKGIVLSGEVVDQTLEHFHFFGVDREYGRLIIHLEAIIPLLLMIGQRGHHRLLVVGQMRPLGVKCVNFFLFLDNRQRNLPELILTWERLVNLILLIGVLGRTLIWQNKLIFILFLVKGRVFRLGIHLI